MQLQNSSGHIWCTALLSTLWQSSPFKTTWLDTWWFAFCYGSCSLVAALVVVGEVASEVSKVMVEL
jgi:hypothetical protein